MVLNKKGKIRTNKNYKKKQTRFRICEKYICSIISSEETKLT